MSADSVQGQRRSADSVQRTAAESELLRKFAVLTPAAAAQLSRRASRVRGFAENRMIHFIFMMYQAKQINKFLLFCLRLNI